jgi:hypothetical protein
MVFITLFRKSPGIEPTNSYLVAITSAIEKSLRILVIVTYVDIEYNGLVTTVKWKMGLSTRFR